MHYPNRIRIFLCAAVCLTNVSGTFADNIYDANKAIKEANTRTLRALMAGDAEKYLALLHPDYIEADAHGVGVSRARVREAKIKTLSQWRLAQSSFSFVAFQMLSGNKVVITESQRLVWKSRTDAKQQQTVLGGYRRTWLKTKSGWLLYSSRTITEDRMPY